MDDCLEVKVSGSWLKEFGFEYGHKVVVEIIKGQIVIKAVDVEDMDVVDGEEVWGAGITGGTGIMPGTSHSFRGWFPYLVVSLEVITLQYLAWNVL